MILIAELEEKFALIFVNKIKCFPSPRTFTLQGGSYVEDSSRSGSFSSLETLYKTRVSTQEHVTLVPFKLDLEKKVPVGLAITLNCYKMLHYRMFESKQPERLKLHSMDVNKIESLDLLLA